MGLARVRAGFAGDFSRLLSARAQVLNMEAARGFGSSRRCRERSHCVAGLQQKRLSFLAVT